MRFEALAAVVLCAASLGGCVEDQPAAQAGAPPPVPSILCKKGPDCDAKWSRAQTWVSQNAGYRIQVANDGLIQTYGSTDTSLAVVVNKTNIKGDQYEIVAQMSCGNDISCFPDPHRALVDFANFVKQ